MSISKMNKPELYELCKKQQDELTKLNFLNGCLVEENEKLKEEKEELEEEWGTAHWRIEYGKLKQENEKLKEENKNLVYEITSDEKVIYFTKLSEENEKLKKENKELEEYIPFEKECNDKCKEIQKLKEENIKLDELWEEEFQSAKRYCQEVKRLRKFIRDLD